MGSWGPGLYSSDYALDLKRAVLTLCRLPLDGNEILRHLGELSPVATDEGDEENTTFWLVVADQFQRKGIESDVRERALEIIDSDTNIAALKQSEMSHRDLRKRRQSLARLAEKLRHPPAAGQRQTLKKPQPLVAESGNVFAYPVDSETRCRNPHIADPEVDRFLASGWRSCLVITASHALGYLAWYQVAPSLRQWSERPPLSEAIRFIDPSSNGVGTLSKVHMKRLGLELCGSVDTETISPPDQSTVFSAVANDNCISGWLAQRLLDSRRDIIGDLARLRAEYIGAQQGTEEVLNDLEVLAAAAVKLGLSPFAVRNYSGVDHTRQHAVLERYPNDIARTAARYELHPTTKTERSHPGLFNMTDTFVATGR